MPANPDLAWALEDVRARLPRYALARAYDEGNHRLLFATEKFLNTFGRLFQEFADNMCDDVLDAIGDRLQMKGWSSNEPALAEGADLAWSRNQGQARMGAVHRNGFREGDGFAIVQTAAKDGLSRYYRQDPAQMAVRYSVDAPDEMELAAKVWKAGKRYRVNLFYPDRTERYASRGVGADGGLPQVGAFRLLEAGDPLLAEDQEAVDPTDDGIPVFHYPNGALSNYGRSLLSGVIPLQDALNKSIADMLVAMEEVALPGRWGTGIQVERDPVTGEEREPFKKRGPGTVMRTGSKDAKFGQFDAADTVPFLEVSDAFRIAVARKGYLPPYALTLRSGTQNAPSGIALLVSEGRTVKLAKDRQRDWGAEHRRAMAYMLRLDGYADVTADDITDDWAPAETRDETALMETLLMKKELGVPAERLLSEAGYDSDDVADWLDEAQGADEGQAAALSVLQGGRGPVTQAMARTLNGALGVPSGPAPAPGSTTALAGQ